MTMYRTNEVVDVRELGEEEERSSSEGSYDAESVDPSRDRRRKTNDPQMVLEGRYMIKEKADLIVFSLNLALFEIVFIVNVPPEGEDRVKVYAKFKTNRSPRA